ncbi:MAG TPA: hypothetical protein VFX12_14660 [Vicinamibacterales bacterium]|nr:hypothetical protein [Vicinamibacterales bacterium]
MPPDNDDLEALADRELRRLPAPRAPQTLLPRVMAAVEAWSPRPWYLRPWFAWPIVWRVASMAPLAALAYFLVRLPPPPQRLVAATDAGGVLWNLLVVPLLPYIFVIVGLMGLACVVFGLALNYVLLEKAEQP